MTSFGKFFVVSGLPVLLLAACQQQRQAQQVAPTEGEQTPAAEVTEKTAAPQKKTTPRVKTAPEKTETAPSEEVAPKAEAFPPVKAEPYVPKTPGLRISNVSVPGPYVALTFDDGPSPANTPKILDILKEHGAHATFFVAGENAVGNKRILARAVAEGNEIGAHTYSHINLLHSSDERIEREMSRTNAIIESATGRAPKLMRPPYGATNTRIVNKMHHDYGMASILWDVDTRDWQHPGVQTVIRRAVGNARPGSIILVHDIHASTLAAVEGIVTGLQARGFKLVTVSRLLALAGGAAPDPEPVDSPAPADAEAEKQPDGESPTVQPEQNMGAVVITTVDQDSPVEQEQSLDQDEQ